MRTAGHNRILFGIPVHTGVTETVARVAEVRLKFRFGDWCLHVHRLKGTVIREQFSTAAPRESFPDVSPESGMDVLFDPSVPVAKPLPVLHFGAASIRYVAAQYSRYYIDLDADFPTFLARLSRHRRHELRRKLRGFAGSSDRAPVFREFRRAPEMDEFYRIARQISLRSYQAKFDAGLPDDMPFVDELRARAESDGVRGFILFQGERPVAYLLCFGDGDCLSGVHCGYDPGLRKYSPGEVLLYRVLEHLFAERRFRVFDFGRGEQAYKSVFATGSIFCADIYYFRRTAFNLCLIGVHLALHGISGAVAGVLEALGLKRRLKRLIRHQP